MTRARRKLRMELKELWKTKPDCRRCTKKLTLKNSRHHYYCNECWSMFASTENYCKEIVEKKS
jgi:hypothetical protein